MVAIPGLCLFSLFFRNRFISEHSLQLRKNSFLCHSDPAKRGRNPYCHDKFSGCTRHRSWKIVGIPRRFAPRNDKLPLTVRPKTPWPLLNPCNEGTAQNTTLGSPAFI